MNRLVKRGHTDIAVALPANDLNLGRLLLAGYREALEAKNIPFDRAYAIRTESSEAGGYRLGTELLNLTRRPTAVILSYELPAGGLYRRLGEAGVPPGKGMAVIGFRESPQTRHLLPRLTSFSTSLRDLGVALGEMLLSQMPACSASYPDWPTHQVCRWSYCPAIAIPI